MINSVSNSNNLIDYSIKSKVESTQEGTFEKELTKAINEKDEKKLKETCRNFEAIFINMIFKQMQSSIQKSKLFDGGFAEEVYQDMLTDKYSEEASKGTGIGLGDMLYKQLSRNMKKSEG